MQYRYNTFLGLLLPLRRLAILLSMIVYACEVFQEVLYFRIEMLCPTLSRCKTRKNPLPSAAYPTRRLHAIQERGADGIASCRTLGSFRPYCLCYQELTSD